MASTTYLVCARQCFSDVSIKKILSVQKREGWIEKARAGVDPWSSPLLTSQMKKEISMESKIFFKVTWQIGIRVLRILTLNSSPFSDTMLFPNSKLCEGRDIPGLFLTPSHRPCPAQVLVCQKHSIIFIECLNESETSQSLLFLQGQPLINYSNVNFRTEIISLASLAPFLTPMPWLIPLSREGLNKTSGEKNCYAKYKYNFIATNLWSDFLFPLACAKTPCRQCGCQ